MRIRSISTLPTRYTTPLQQYSGTFKRIYIFARVYRLIDLEGQVELQQLKMQVKRSVRGKSATLRELQHERPLPGRTLNPKRRRKHIHHALKQTRLLRTTNQSPPKVESLLEACHATSPLLYLIVCISLLRHDAGFGWRYEMQRIF